MQNCYFLDNGKFEEKSGVVKKSEADLKSEAMLTLLNAGGETENWQADTKNLNNGFPVLAWQNDPSAGVAYREVGNVEFGVMNGTLYILNANQGEVVRVYSILGTLVYEGCDTAIEVAQRGVYVVTVGNKVAKVRI